MDKQRQEKAMAFAGILNALSLVQKIARTGEMDIEATEACLSSIPVTNPDSISDVYPDKSVLENGYKLTLQQLGDSDSKDIEITRYLVAVLSLERKLAKSGNTSQLGERIGQLDRQLIHFKITDEQIIRSLASIYVDLVSVLGPRIMVAGKPDIIKQTSTQERIRAYLLAATRSAVLWRQLGGKRRELVFQRRKLVEAAKYNLQNI
ncbi:high frequency lysogenization protein HflD [Shewanella sp. 202IG2-18]|uniref:high frequency lysogenization protein HflD n=1 Tax=Parashewanella hymeniacidonis TaxID=2807618 RepID=UPI001961438D|nr:high frequency lysogenization protein HflD [Parashewanella hymeniacidonis]MBM7073606.1 high frequency lysogenization protein HflD [Parashewanella hymeniacidonis]